MASEVAASEVGEGGTTEGSAFASAAAVDVIAVEDGRAFAMVVPAVASVAIKSFGKACHQAFAMDCGGAFRAGAGADAGATDAGADAGMAQKGGGVPGAAFDVGVAGKTLAAPSAPSSSLATLTIPGLRTRKGLRLRLRLPDISKTWDRAPEGEDLRQSA